MSDLCNKYDFEVFPMTAHCRRVYASGDHIVVGVSLGNSHFRAGMLTEMFRWMKGRFARVDVVIPDTAFQENLRVLGRSEGEAERKARQETNTARNRVVRAWNAAELPAPAARHVHLLSDLAETGAYRVLREHVEEAMDEDPVLRRACREMSRLVLEPHLDGAPTDDQIRGGVRYLLAELPFFVGSAEIFEVPSSLCFYHRPVPVAELIFTGRTALRRSPMQGYATIRPISRAEKGRSQREMADVRA